MGPVAVDVLMKQIAALFAILLTTGVHAQTSVDALPTGGKVAMGQASISQSSNTMNVVQASQRAVIN